MIEKQREATLRRVLERQEVVTLGELQELTGASVATVRRDLARLQAQGVIRRVRGGACLTEATAGKRGNARQDGSDAAEAGRGGEAPVAERVGVLAEKKRKIGLRAAAMCRSGQTIFVDGGSTTYYLARALVEPQLTVITNSFSIARVLFDRSASRVILPGGEIERDSELIFDSFNSDFYDDYIADIAFLGAEGIDAQGLTNTEARLVHDERRMMRQAKQVVVLADAGKFGRYGHIRLCKLDEIDLVITDSALSPHYRTLLQEYDIEAIVT